MKLFVSVAPPGLTSADRTEKIRKKPSTQRDSNPRPWGSLLARSQNFKNHLVQCEILLTFLLQKNYRRRSTRQNCPMVTFCFTGSSCIFMKKKSFSFVLEIFYVATFFKFHEVMKCSKPRWFSLYIIQDVGSRTAVEYMPYNREVVSSNPVGGGLFSLHLLNSQWCFLKQVAH